MKSVTHSHAVLLTQLLNSDLVQSGRHVFQWLLEVLRVSLHQELRNTTAAMLEEKSWKRERCVNIIKHRY